nr:hypothetical protein [Tanacetum cinerariifolium]
AGPNRGSKKQKEGGEQTSASTPSERATKGTGGSTTRTQSRQQSTSQSAHAEEPVQTTCQMEETPLPVYETGADDQPIVQISQHPEWFSQPRKPPSPDRAWNTALPATQGDAQSWISKLAKQADARSSFNELLDTPIDFSNFIMHRLNVDTLTPDLLAGPTYELMKGSCSSLTELEYHLEEVSKRQKEGGEHATASNPSETETEGAGRSTTGSQSRQMSANFSNFIMHRLNVDTLTPDLLAGPTYELMRGSCTSLTELEYHLEEVYKVTTNQLDWVNPE